MPFQDIRQVRMICQRARFRGFELSGATVEHGIDIVPGKAGCIQKALDIRMRMPTQHRKAISLNATSRRDRWTNLSRTTVSIKDVAKSGAA